MNTNVRSSGEDVFSGVGTAELLNSLADGVYITDLNRKILFWNQAAERMTGWRAAEIVGKSCYDNLLLHVDKDGRSLCGQEFCPLHRSIVTGLPSEEPLLVFAQCKSTERLPVEVSVAPLRDRDGQTVGGIEVFRDLRELLHDLLRAKGIQEQALSCNLPSDPRLELEVRYQAREIVGGDFYRIERQDQVNYNVLVADAMGHGVAAALYTMQLRTLWDVHRQALSSPARFLELLSARLHGLVGDTGYFATAVGATYNAATGQVRCVRAGHPPAFLFRADGAIESVGSAQLALGMRADVNYSEATASLGPGDTLLFFTDGAIELFDAQDRELGLSGLKQLVTELKDGTGNFRLTQVEEKLLGFSGQIHLPDDLTLIKLRRLN